MSPPVHVGIDATTWSNDRGFGRFTREFVTALAARDSEFRYTLVFDQHPAQSVPEGVGSVVVDTGTNLGEASSGSNARSAAYLLKLDGTVRRAGFDLFFFPAVYSYFPLLSSVPKVICYHDATAERLPQYLFPTRRNRFLWNVKTRLAIWQTTRAMTVSHSSARDLKEILGIPDNKIDVVTEAADPVFRPIDNPVAATEARTRFGIPADARLLVHVGGMNAHKNILGLLSAIPGVARRRPDVHLAIVGSTAGTGFWDNVPELRAFIDDTPGLADHVTFTGYIPDAGLVELFAGTDALVFPSLWEGFGLPAIEAMSCGVPVLASDRGSLPEVVGNAGLFFDPEDRVSIETTLLRFLEDDQLAACLRMATLPRAAEFTWDAAAEMGEASFRKAVS